MQIQPMSVGFVLKLAFVGTLWAHTANATPIERWLISINPTLAQYANGFETVGLTSKEEMIAAPALLESVFGKLRVKKPHRRLILNQIDEDRQACAAKHTPSTEASIDIETKYSNNALSTLDSEAWFKEWNEQHSDESELVAAVDSKQWKKVARMCKNGQIAEDAKVYGVPLLNWIGQFVEPKEQKALFKLLKRLIRSGMATNKQVIARSTGPIPAVVKAYQNLPLLLQYTEVERTTDSMELLDSGGASLKDAFRLPDGRSTGLTPLHVNLKVCDPSDSIHAMNERFLNGDKLLPTISAKIKQLRGLARAVHDGNIAGLLTGKGELFDHAVERIRFAAKEMEKAAKQAEEHGRNFSWSQSHMQTIRNGEALDFLLGIRMHYTHALYSCTMLMHCTLALYSCTVLMHYAHALCSCTILMHHAHALCSCTVLLHYTHALYSCTILMHYQGMIMHCTHAPCSCTILLHCTRAPYSCTILMHYQGMIMHCTHTLYSCTIRMHCTRALYSCTVLVHHTVGLFEVLLDNDEADRLARELEDIEGAGEDIEGEDDEGTVKDGVKDGSRLQDMFGRTPLHYAAKSGHVYAVQLLGSAFPALLDVKDQAGWTAMVLTL
jgi:hypothetical protein